MTTVTYDKPVTALLVIDPYNDFISEGGKSWPRIKAVAEANDCVPHMRQVLHSARAAKLTMNREGIRRLAAEELKLPTSPYRFVATREEFAAAADAMKYPCVIKPIMSSSGKGQSLVKSAADLDKAFFAAVKAAGGKSVEGKRTLDHVTRLTDELKRRSDKLASALEHEGKSAEKHGLADSRLPTADSHPLQLTGRTHCDRIVVFDGNRRQIGHSLSVVVYDANAHTLFGEIVTRHSGPELYELALLR